MTRESVRLNLQKNRFIKKRIFSKPIFTTVYAVNESISNKSILLEDQQSNMSASAARLIKVNA